MKKVVGIFLGIIVTIVVIIGIAFGTGMLNVKYTETVGLAQQNADTKVFHHTQAYVDGAVTDLAKIKLEYKLSNDATAKKALINYVIENYSNLDPNQINNASVADWLKNIQDGLISK